MREYRSYGSARGAPGNRRPYRDPRAGPEKNLTGAIAYEVISMWSSKIWR